MKISDAQAAIELCIECNLPVHMWGPPGIGKSSLIAQIAKNQGRELIDLRMSLLNPVDLRGIPMARGDATEWLRPSFLPSGDSNAILFLDELNVAPPSVQAAAYQLVLDRKVGEYQLPKGVTILAAGNRGTDRALVYEMPSPLRNRFMHIDIDVDLDTWKDWAIGVGNIDPMIISFLNMKSERLFFFDPKIHTRGFPTPRSWEFSSRILVKLGRSQSLKSSEIFAGLLGEGTATEFIAFLRLFGKLPDAAEVIVKGDMKLVPPKSPDTLHAFVGALVGCVNRLKKKAEQQNGVSNLVTYCARKLQAEFAVVAIKDFTRGPLFQGLKTGIMGSAAWKEFCDKYGSLIMK